MPGARTKKNAKPGRNAKPAAGRDHPPAPAETDTTTSPTTSAETDITSPTTSAEATIAAEPGTGADDHLNRAARRARGKGKAQPKVDGKISYGGRQNPVQSPRLWANRRSG